MTRLGQGDGEQAVRHFRIGDRVGLRGANGKDREAAFEGVVVAYCDVAYQPAAAPVRRGDKAGKSAKAGRRTGPRQKLWVRSEADGHDIRMVVVDLDAPACGEPTGRIFLEPLDMATADTLATMILEGREVRLPVEVQLNTLAIAVLQATPRARGAGQEKETKR